VIARCSEGARHGTNHVLGNQALQSLWIEQSDNEVRERQYNAAIAGLIGMIAKLLRDARALVKQMS
jgi:hypothetical protein